MSSDLEIAVQYCDFILRWVSSSWPGFGTSLDALDAPLSLKADSPAPSRDSSLAAAGRSGIYCKGLIYELCHNTISTV
jgi:hypothetical protein